MFLPHFVFFRQGNYCSLVCSLLDIYINDLCAQILYSKFLLFADNQKVFSVSKSTEKCSLLQ
jgi:hypothetical protein